MGGDAKTNGSASESSSTTAGRTAATDGGPTMKQKPAPLPKPSRQGVDAAFAQYGQLMHASRRPVPTQMNDGTTMGVFNKRKVTKDLKTLKRKDWKTIIALVKSKLKGEQVIDDKTMIMEKVIQVVAGLPSNSRLREELTNNFIDELWNTLDHPPLLYTGEKFMYRQPDGSWNNPMNPMLGAAGSTYARTCRPGVIPLGAQPDPSLIFETIMRRTTYTKHPNNVSSVLWYWATIVIHDLFWTDYADMNKTKTSSFLDLSPLYGSNQEMQDSIRTFKDGMMKPDTYADKRLLGMPPGCSVLLIMFNRFHNYIAANLAAINENGRFTPPAPGLPEDKAAAAWKKYDNDLFQTARLVTSGMYINITLVDYVRNIVNLNRSNTTWTLDPRAEMGKDAGTNDLTERGTGSMVSAEFNLCYRWHSCISDKDDKWIQEFFGSMFNKDPSEVTTQDMMMGFMKFDKSIPEDPAYRTFGGFQRGSDGKFSDDELVGCISDAIEDCAGSFGGRNVPGAMKPVEILGILQGRKWNVAGLNEFRKHFGLKPHTTFEDINSDPEIAGSLRNLYEHPDFVELYPGLVAEERKEPMVPGVGIAPTYTISRVILSDAVCLTRGDRHYTTDYNPRYLTSWGFNEVSYDLEMNQGCVFYKLFIRAFPNHFKDDSVYAHYPMCVPSETKKILTDLGRVHEFNFERPSTARAKPVNVTSFDGAQHVFNHPEKYNLATRDGLSFLKEVGGSQPSQQGTFAVSQHVRSEWQAGIKKFYATTTDKLLQEQSFQMAGANFVDVIRDVGNIAPTRFAASLLKLPLKTDKSPKGAFTDGELYMALAILNICLYTHVDPVKAFPMRKAAQAVTHQLGKLAEANVKSATGLFASKPEDDVAAYGVELIKELKKAGLSPYDIAWGQFVPTAAAVTPNVAEVFAQAVDFYLSAAGTKALPALQGLAQQASTAENDALLFGYVMEGVRLSGNIGAFREAAADDVIGQDDGKLSVKSQDRITVNFAKSFTDPNHFPTPDEVNPGRPTEALASLALGAQSTLGREVAQSALTEMARSVFRLKGLRRSPGPQGELKRVARPEGLDVYMREDRGAYFPFPCTMKVCWDI